MRIWVKSNASTLFPLARLVEREIEHLCWKDEEVARNSDSMVMYLVDRRLYGGVVCGGG
jgi:hypothetical protein